METVERAIETLLIASHVVHFRHEGRIYAYAPYAREIDIWADLFPHVLIAAPCYEHAPRGDCSLLMRTNIALVPIRQTGGRTLAAKMRQLFWLPGLAWSLSRAMRRCDAVHVRCPGNLGMLGAALAPLHCRYLVAKYTGQWDGFPGEPRSWKWQRRLLRSAWWRGPVAIYGGGDPRTPKVVSLFTSVMTAEQMRRAQQCAAERVLKSPVAVLYCGRLTASKNVDVLLQAIARVKAAGLPVSCRVVGEGPERSRLEALCAQLGLRDHVRFFGGVDFQQVLDFYEQSDVLVLASQTESWGKSLTEAMAFGMICVASDRGLMPEMLAQGRGFVVPPRDVDALAAVLARIARDPPAFRETSQRAAAWGRQYSLENLRDALRTMLEQQWKVPLGAGPQTPDAAARAELPADFPAIESPVVGEPVRTP